MSQILVEVINNIESILPLYEVTNSDLKRTTQTLDKIVTFNTVEMSVSNEESENTSLSNEEMIDLDLLEAREGTERLIMHIKRERNPSFMKKCKKLFAVNDELLHCQICQFSFIETYGKIGKDFIEGHHIIPISELEDETVIKPNDILMVCSNCHRMIHRQNPCFTKEHILQSLKK